MKEQDKIKQICQLIRQESIEKAQQEAEVILENAKNQAEQMISEARLQALKLMEEAQKNLEQEKNVFHLSLVQSAKLSFEALKQKIESQLFTKNLEETIAEASSRADFVAKLLEAIVMGIEREGLSNDLAAYIPKSCTSEEIVRGLTAETLKKLSKHPIEISHLNGGAQVRLLDKNIVLSITDKEIAEYLAQYVRKDFRKFIFISQES